MAKTPDKTERAPKRKIDPKVKAQLALDVAQRKLTAAEQKRDTAEAALKAAQAELPPLRAQVDYLAANPLLSGPVVGETVSIPAQQDSPEL